MTIFNCNIRSISANGDTLVALLQSLYTLPDVLVVTETWLKPEDGCNFLEENYDGYHTARSHGRSGGVSVFVGKETHVRKIDRLSVCTQTMESCVLLIRFQNREIVIYSIYRPHSDSIEGFTDIMQETLHDREVRGKEIVVVGDLNINLLLQDNDHVGEFSAVMQSLSFLPTITRPTRFDPTGSSDPSLLDHIWVNRLGRYISGILHYDITDHCPTFYCLQKDFQSQESFKISFRSHKAQYFDGFREALRRERFNFDDPENVSTDTEKFCETLNTLYCRYFPLKIKYISTKRLSKPWLSSAILNSIKTKAHYFKLCKLGIISKETNKRYKNILTSTIRAAKVQFYRQSLCTNKNNIKKTWNLLRVLMQSKCSKSNIVNCLNIDGQEITEETVIAERFNHYFSTVARNLEAEIEQAQDICPLANVRKDIVNSLFLRPVTTEECLNVVSSLKNTKYNINIMPVFVFKSVIVDIVQYVVKLINSSFMAGIFPECLKHATITPIYKKDNKQTMSNYRPISVLPLMSKVFERCVAERLWSFFNKHSIISQYQFGFQKGKSTLDALINLTENIYSALNESKHTACVFIDLRKAFDTVNHGILLRKLYCYGIRGLPLKWFSDYLSNRTHCVKIGTHISGAKTSSIGIPQGSIVGPILFLCYINDLPNACPNMSTLLYADDTTLTTSHYDYQSLIKTLNSELVAFKKWAIVNRLSINTDKTISLLVTNRFRDIITPLKLKLDKDDINFDNSSRFLGIEIDRCIKFNIHIRNILSKISRTVGIFYKIKDYLSETQMINLYYSLVYPYLTYGNETWGNSYAVHINPLLLLQKKTCKNYNAFRLSISYRPLILQNRYSEGARYSHLFAGNTHIQAE